MGRLAKAVVFRASKEKTYTGLRKADLMKTKTGKIVTSSTTPQARRAMRTSRAGSRPCRRLGRPSASMASRQ